MWRDKKEIPCKLFDIQKWIPEFLIDHEKRTALCFQETLVVCLKNEFAKDIKPVGGYCVLVESIGPQTHEFLVHVQSSMSIDGHFGGTKVISSATSKFHCLEEKRTEFLYEDDNLHEKSIYIGIEDDSYHVKLMRTCRCNQSEEIKNLSFCCNDRLISEGVNILLMRYLALINYEGTLSLQAISIDGELTTSNYKCSPSERMEIDGYFLNVYTVERKMHKQHKQDGHVHTIKTYLTSQGRILRHNWLDVPYILKINPLIDPTTANSTIKAETLLRDRWTEDIEMLSKYLDKKYSKMAEHTEYLADHPEVKQLIADYIQTLLVVKPENVIDFTIQHFKAFANNPISWETSIQEKNYDVDVRSQLAKEESEIVCGACEFKIKSATLKEMPSKSSIEECSTIVNSYNSMQSVQSYEVSISKSSTSFEKESVGHEDNLRFEAICHKCHATIKVSDKRKSLLKCSGCLRIINTCSKCSTIDQIIHMLKE